jgi:hypothetical protein
VTVRALLKLLDVGDVGNIRPRGIGGVSAVVANNAAQSAGGFVQKRWSETGSAIKTFVWIVMKENEAAASGNIESKNRSLLLKRDYFQVNR